MYTAWFSISVVCTTDVLAADGYTTLLGPVSAGCLASSHCRSGAPTGCIAADRYYLECP